MDGFAFLWVALGSATGGVLRYAVSLLLATGGLFPWGTLAVNVLGSLAIGALSGFLARGGAHAEVVRAFAVVGVCGGFTTFSTFSNEMFRLFESGRCALAVAYAAVSLLGGLLAVLAGYAFSRL